MITGALKKLAKAQNMTLAQGIAYGSFRGYAVTFSEGSGYKYMGIATRFPTQQAMEELEQALTAHDLQKEFRVQDLNIFQEGIAVTFLDNPGTMKRIQAFFDLLFPLLPQFGATQYGICSQCGQNLGSDGVWKKAGDMAIHVHPGCAQRLLRQAEMEEEEARSSDTGSYGKGLLGALVGGLIGAIPWAIVLYLGYFAAILGAVIGFLAQFFYQKFHGKQGKPKILILLLAAIVGVLVGTLGEGVIELAIGLITGELEGSFGDILPFIFTLLASDPEFRAMILRTMGIGLLFALLGMSGTLLHVHRENKAFTLTDLPG